jgi:hypothetical protein
LDNYSDLLHGMKRKTRHKPASFFLTMFEFKK